MFFIFFDFYWWDIVRRKNTVRRHGSSRRALLDPFFEGRRETDEEFYALTTMHSYVSVSK